jgi:hypothetical protein
MFAVTPTTVDTNDEDNTTVAEATTRAGQPIFF